MCRIHVKEDYFPMALIELMLSGQDVGAVKPFAVNYIVFSDACNSLKKKKFFF